MGPPGVGKGTQAKIIKDKLGIVHISTGELLRYEIAEKTDVGAVAKKYIDQGKLVPDEFLFELVRHRLNEPDCTSGYILDGFPRTINQASSLDVKISDLGARIKSVIYLDILDEKIINRLQARGRNDDKPDLIINRLNVYRDQTEPLLGYYNEKKLLDSINGDQKMEDVNSSILNVITEKVI